MVCTFPVSGRDVGEVACVIISVGWSIYFMAVSVER